MGGETKFVSPEVHYLKEESLAPNSNHWDVVLMCEDGVTYRTSRLVLAAMSAPAIRATLLETSMADEDVVSIYVESPSTDVLQFLHFVHTGCVYTR